MAVVAEELHRLAAAVFPPRMWKGLYSPAETPAPPAQTPVDFLSSVREGSQQLEQQLANQQEVAAGGPAPLGSRQGIQHTKTRPLYLKPRLHRHITASSPIGPSL